MNLIFRLFWVVISSRFLPRLGFLEPDEQTFRVWPLDLDINWHMTNSRYYSLMDLGRIRLALRSRVGHYVLKNRLNMIVGGGITRHRRALAPFQKFRLRTHILGWDDRWFYMEHRMMDMDGQVVCTSQMRGGFLEKGKMVAPAELIKVSGENAVSPALPAWISQWLDVDTLANA